MDGHSARWQLCRETGIEIVLLVMVAVEVWLCNCYEGRVGLFSLAAVMWV